MSTWLTKNRVWAALNLFALAVMGHLLVNIGELSGMNDGLWPLVHSGKWAMRFLLLSLAITPLNTLFGWRGAIPLRKPAGLWAFGFGLLHLIFYVIEAWPYWLDYPIPDLYAGLGVAGLLILAVMAVTSTRWAMRRMGKNWKRLHRLVYAAGIILVTHGMLESMNSKRVGAVDPYAYYEAWIYIVILVGLLAVRIPPVRNRLTEFSYRRARSQPSI